MPSAKSPPPYGTVVFDCDSTLSRIEGIEELAGERADEIREWTERAMNGEVPLEEVYGARLERIKPTAQDVAQVGARYVTELCPGVRELVAALRFLGKRVAIVSGGLLQPVRHLARAIGVDEGEVDAVAVLHAPDGSYAGFDEESPLARAGGKLVVLEEICSGADAAPPVALVGDGATDLEAAPVCARFIAFGGVARREAVFAAADATCDTPDFAGLLHLLCSDSECETLERHDEHAPLVARARTLTQHRAR
jgi:phosphoserine phosphatase